MMHEMNITIHIDSICLIVAFVIGAALCCQYYSIAEKCGNLFAKITSLLGIVLLLYSLIGGWILYNDFILFCFKWIGYAIGAVMIILLIIIFIAVILNRKK